MTLQQKIEVRNRLKRAIRKYGLYSDLVRPLIIMNEDISKYKTRNNGTKANTRKGH